MRLLRVLVWSAVLSLSCPSLWAHGIVGQRMFIEPLFTEDANVKNELVLPFAGFGVQPDGTWRQFRFSFEKQLYPDRVSFVLEGGRVDRHAGNDRLSGWDNLELGLKYEAYTNESREFVISPALFATLPLGSNHVVDHETSLTPMLLYGKGFGDLHLRYFRPFAIQGDVGIEASLESPHEKKLRYDTVLFYSIPYLNHFVRNADSGYSMEHCLRRGFSRGALLGDLFPYLEFNGEHTLRGESGSAGSSLRPGILWMGKYAQVSIAADIPIQYPSVRERPHKGFFLTIDWFLDEIIPGISWTPFGNKSHRHHE
jgi:hypothetical protein